MKKVIITGGCGFIGSHLIYRALKKKYFVINLDKLSYASQKMKIKNKNYKFFKLDLKNEKKLNYIFKKFEPDIVINCAAESHVDNSIKGPKVFYESNLIGTVNLLNNSIQSKKDIKFLQVSTDEVFGSLRFNKSKFTENSRYNPRSPYSSSKAAADHAVRAYGETYKLKYFITNCSNNYGPYQYPEKLIPLVITNCINKKMIPVYGNGKNVRDWIHVNDHVNAIFAVLEKSKPFESYLIGANNEISNIQLVKLICDKYKKLKNDSFDYKKLIKFVTDRKGHDLRYAISSKKIKKKLGWVSKIKFQDGIEKTIKFYIKNQNLKKIYFKI